MAAAAAADSPGRLALLVDEASDRRFLVDTGSAVSIIPHSSVLPPTGPSILTADGTPIRCRGGGRQPFWRAAAACGGTLF